MTGLPRPRSGLDPPTPWMVEFHDALTGSTGRGITGSTRPGASSRDHSAFLCPSGRKNRARAEKTEHPRSCRDLYDS